MGVWSCCVGPNRMLRRILASEGCWTIPTQHPGWTEIERDSARDLTALIDAGGHVGGALNPGGRSGRKPRG
jgi:hypothetical protein